MPTTVDIGSLITKHPDMHGGRPCLAGTGMTVLPIADLQRQGLSAETILADHFPHLDLARIYAALAYCAANPEEIDAYFREDIDAEEIWLASLKARRGAASR